MNVKWHNLISKNKYFKLIIEGDVYPKTVYNLLSINYNFNYLLIRSYDLSMNFDILTKQFVNKSIKFSNLNQRILIEFENIKKVFDETELGTGMDSFYLFESYPQDDRFSNNSNLYLDFNLLKGNNLYISYEEIPDLIIISINKKLLIEIMDNFNLKY